MEAASNGLAEAWRERIVAQQASGQTIRAWCRQHGQQEHAFYWWRRRLGLSPSVQRPRPGVGKAMKFAEVLVGRVAGEGPRFVLGGGRELVLGSSMALEQIARLVHLIEGTK